MITNLFSIFDPTLRLFSFSWVVGLFAFLVFPISFWRSYSTLPKFFSVLLIGAIKEISYVLPLSVKGVFKFICRIFVVISCYNFIALFPHIFSVTSHLLVTLPFSYSFWIGVVLFRWIKSFSHFLSHLIPVGTPLGLISFMVIVEVLSNLIRPLALTFRLTANIIAGHLLISLVGGFLVSLPLLSFFVGSVMQSLLVFMELGVSVIQAYVFSTLLLLYLSERESH